MPAFGASRSLPRVPAKVGLPKRKRLLSVVGGNGSKCPEAAIRGAHRSGRVRWWEVYRITVVAAVAPIGSSRNLDIASRQNEGHAIPQPANKLFTREVSNRSGSPEARGARGRLRPEAWRGLEWPVQAQLLPAPHHWCRSSGVAYACVSA